MSDVYDAGLRPNDHGQARGIKIAGHPVPKGQPILELRALRKLYGAVEALKPADLTFLSGEIHAIVVKTAPESRR